MGRVAEKEHGGIFGNRKRLLEGYSTCRERLLLFYSDVGVELHLVDALELAYDKCSAIRSESPVTCHCIFHSIVVVCVLIKR